MKITSLVSVCILTIFIGMNLYSQNKFIYDSNGLTPSYLVNEIKGKGADEIYGLALKWIQKNFNTPDEVIKSQIKNELLRFEGVKQDGICFSGLTLTCYDLYYHIELEFKDNKFKFQIVSLSYRIPVNSYGTGGIKKIYLNSGSDEFYGEYYKKNGNIKNAFSKFPDMISSTLNSINTELVKNLSGTEKESDW